MLKIAICDEQQLFGTPTLAFSKIDFTEEKTFTVKTVDSLRVLKLMDVVCCEYRSRDVIITIKNGEEIVSRTIVESFGEYISPVLKDCHFLQSHTSFVINMRRVERFAKDSFILKGEIIPIVAKQYTVV